jgi:hypothetical protein
VSGKGMKFQESPILNKWVSVHCNKKHILQSKHQKQGDKPRIGNRFLVVGANTRVGWATICQLAHKFPGCEMMFLDEYYKINDRYCLTDYYPFIPKVRKLKEYYNFEHETGLVRYSDQMLVQSYLNQYEPDVILYLDQASETGLDNFMIANQRSIHVPFLNIGTIYRVKNFEDFTFPILNIKYSHIVGTFNLITLVDQMLSPLNVRSSYPEWMIHDAIKCKKIFMSTPMKYYCTSLENLTRAIVKSIRRGWENDTTLVAIEQQVSTFTMAKLVIDTFKKYYNINIDCNIEDLKEEISVPNDIRKESNLYKNYLDKFRISLRDTIIYSTINVMENNSTEIHKGQKFYKKRPGEKHAKEL